MSVRAVILLLLAGCSTPPVPVDVERDKIASWIESYCAASARAERTRTAGGPEYGKAASELLARRADLERVSSTADGARWVGEEIASRSDRESSRLADLRRRELEMSARAGSLSDEERVELGGVARERYDLEIRLSALGHLRESLSPASDR